MPGDEAEVMFVFFEVEEGLRPTCSGHLAVFQVWRMLWLGHRLMLPCSLEVTDFEGSCCGT